MIKNFESVCVRMSEARAMEIDAEKVLNVLLENGGQMRAKEIAEASGFVWGNHHVNYQRANHPLKWLVQLGMVQRIEIEGEPIEVDDERYVYDCEDGKPLNLVIDGVLYVREDRHNIGRRGHWETYKKTITPKIAVFQIAE